VICFLVMGTKSTFRDTIAFEVGATSFALELVRVTSTYAKRLAFDFVQCT